MKKADQHMNRQWLTATVLVGHINSVRTGVCEIMLVYKCASKKVKSKQSGTRKGHDGMRKKKQSIEVVRAAADPRYVT